LTDFTLENLSRKTSGWHQLKKKILKFSLVCLRGLTAELPVFIVHSRCEQPTFFRLYVT